MTLSDPTAVLAKTIWAEARGGGGDAMRHVASVVLNRAAYPRWWGSSVLTVCRAPWQFSCWNPLTTNAPPDHNYQAMIAVTDADAAFVAALEVARAAVAGELTDATGGADSYYAHSVAAPAWVHGATHSFDDALHSFWITRHMAHAPAAYRPARAMVSNATPSEPATGPPPHTHPLPQREGDVST